MNPAVANNFKSLRFELGERVDPIVAATADGAFEDRCRDYLQALRWPGGAECPRCSENVRLLWLESRSKWHCYQCRYQFSVTAGTLFHNSHLPVWKWFVAVHLMVESPDGVSASELRRVLGGSYKTAWFVAHRVRAAIRGHGEDLLRSLVEAESARSFGGARSSDELLDEVANLTPRPFPEGVHDGVVARVRRLVAGPHHQLSAKYLPAYVDERRWRAVNRDNPHVFRDTILALLHGEGLSYEQLVASR